MWVKWLILDKQFHSMLFWYDFGYQPSNAWASCMRRKTHAIQIIELYCFGLDISWITRIALACIETK